MLRTFLVAIVCFAAGAGVTWGLLHDSTPGTPSGIPARSAGPLAPEPLTGRGAPLAPDAPAIAERAEVYQSVASADARQLEAMARSALARADRRGRDFELDAIFARLIEVDPDAALAFARDNDLGPARELDVAVLVLDTRGYSERAIDEIMSALPGLDRDQLRGRALERLAVTDPTQALAIVLNDFRNGAAGPVFGPFGTGSPQNLLRIAAVWAGQDPAGALAAIDTIPDMQARQIFAQAVLGRFAQSDPDAALAWVDRMDMPEQQKFGLVQSTVMQLAARAPERAVRYAETLGGQRGEIALMMVVQQWAQRDARAAVAYVENMPPGLSRQNLIQQIASSFGRSDPDAALAWVQTLGPGQGQVYADVLAGIALVDPLRALDLAFDESGPGVTAAAQMQALMSVVSSAAATGTVPPRALADRLLTIDGRQTRESALQVLAQTWVYADVDGALDWFLSNDASLGPNILGDLAREAARQDPRSAAVYTARVPSQLRSHWIGAVASGYAQTDPDGARAWIQQFRGEPAYEAAVLEIVRYSAGSDPAGAAALFGSTDFTDPGIEAQMVTTIAGSWAAQDWPAARNWVATLPRGESRDNALEGMISIRQEIPDAATMSLFSNDERQLISIQNVIMQTAQFDPDRARRMVTEHFDEPWRREQAEQMIENIETGQGSRGFFTRGVPGVAPAIGLRGSGVSVIVQ